MSLRVVLLTLVGCGWGLFGTTAVDAAAPRVRIIPVVKGSPEVVGNGYLADTTDSDQLIFILVGGGAAKLTIYDADAPGDTIAVEGVVASVFPTSFSGTATSPAQFTQTLLITVFGVVVVDVRYNTIVNPLPAQYIYKLKF